MNATTQRLCAWSGVAMIVFWLVGFWLFAGFLPDLPSPQDSAKEITDRYRDDTNALRFGLLLTTTGSALLGPFIAVISVQIKRIEGRSSPLAYTQLALGAILILEFIFPMFFMQANAYRPDRSPEIILALNDVAWLMFVGLVSTAVIEMLIIGIAILRDRRAEPIFPRWMGYLSLWTGFLFCPGSFVVFFKDGPLAWNGIFSWWIPVAAFAVWLAAMTVRLLRAITRQQQEEDGRLAPTGDPGPVTVRDARLAPAAGATPQPDRR